MADDRLKIACPLYTCSERFENEPAKVAHLRGYHGWVVGTALTRHTPQTRDVERSR